VLYVTKPAYCGNRRRFSVPAELWTRRVVVISSPPKSTRQFSCEQIHFPYHRLYKPLIGYGDSAGRDRLYKSRPRSIEERSSRVCRRCLMKSARHDTSRPPVAIIRNETSTITTSRRARCGNTKRNVYDYDVAPPVVVIRSETSVPEYVREMGEFLVRPDYANIGNASLARRDQPPRHRGVVS